ncbi:MAG: VTT domain-containing protein [Patescibacteria group bacterium]|jgi:uncharacterized membrane protein YdjX (TVP38/TMEM64 family)|nr:VTT domain-containing protein [Patescibacteria group bacterium]
MNRKVKEILVFTLIVFLFVLASFLARDFYETIAEVEILENWYGKIIYIVITLLAVLVAPISTLPLLPFAVVLWGPIQAAILTMLGWTAGSFLVFYLSRRYGKKIVGKFVDIQKIESWEEMLPKKNIFWTVVFLRFILPVDVLSYALGLFSKMSIQTYLLATVIGLIPFVLFFAYFSKIPIVFQSIAIVFIVLILFKFYKKIREKFLINHRNS